MSLDRWWDVHYTNTGTASTVARQVSFAGIAVVWIFSNNTPGEITLPSGLLWPALFFVLALIGDFLQYFIASTVWLWFARSQEKKGGVDAKEEKWHPPYLNYPGYFLFYFKCLMVIFGYTALGLNIIKLIRI